jgi:hypothetical protein
MWPSDIVILMVMGPMEGWQFSINFSALNHHSTLQVTTAHLYLENLLFII